MRPFEQVEVLRAACCIAGADGQISDNESALLRKLASESGVGEASLDAMTTRAGCDAKFCDEQFQILKTDPQETIAILLQIAMADGAIGVPEAGSMRAFAGRLGVDQEVFEELLKKAASIAGNRSSQ